MTEQGLWAGRKTGTEIGGLGWSPHGSFDIVFLSLFHNDRVNDVAIKIPGTCLLHLEWCVCSPTLLKTLCRHHCHISKNQVHHVAELLSHYALHMICSLCTLSLEKCLLELYKQQG